MHALCNSAWMGWRLLVVAVVATAPAVPAAATPVIHAIAGYAIDDFHLSSGGGVMAGSVAFGNQRSMYRWTPTGGMQTFSLFQGGSTFGTAMSDDGTTIVGHSSPAVVGPPFTAFRWSSGSGFQALPQYQGSAGRPTAISGDGQIILGTLVSGKGIRWIGTASPEPLPPVQFYGDPSSNFTPYAANYDGSVTAGVAVVNDVYRSLPGMSPEALGVRTSGLNTHHVVGVNESGSIVAGTTRNAADHRQAFRWTAASGLYLIPSLGTHAEAKGMTTDGMTVVGGYGFTAPFDPSEEYIWNAALGTVRLPTYLASLGLNLSGWNLREVMAISPDGSAIAGHGSFNGATVSWVVTNIPGPGTPLMGLGGLAALSLQRKRSIWNGRPAPRA